MEDLDGDEYEISVRLSSAPTAAWQRLFRDSEDRTTLCHPALVRFTGNRLRFTCCLGDAREWLTFIDRWIAAANGEASVAWKVARVALQRSAMERDRGIRLAQALFWDL